MAPPSTPVRVLVIDDDPMSREVLGILLQREGYRVQLAESGDAALALLSREHPAPQVVLTDIQMPGISGAQLAAGLRRACPPGTLLLAMSGSDSAQQTLAQFDSFLMKPFTMADVAAAISAWHESNQILQKTSASATSAGDETASNPNMKLETNTAPDHQPAFVSQPELRDIASGHGPILNETIYAQLSGSMTSSQLRQMYAMCIDDARERIASMHTLAAEGDRVQFVRQAHSIKGGSGMLGASELYRIAAQIEAQGLEAAIPQDVNPLDELAAACDRLERMLGSRAN